ncbi:hypothetical protein [Paenibacillus sp. FSL L8-0463]|uniref:hypothetical protein n=1 Tax=Paenibacillus sp. FSL L8-0463 TaxID=2954687 RepID=UPI0031195FA5
MGKILRFHSLPTLVQLEGVEVNGEKFKGGEGWIGESGIVLNIPNVFRFDTKLEIAETNGGDWDLILTQFLTKGPDYWEMESSFSRIGFRNPEIQVQLEALCEGLIAKGLAHWVEDATA